MIIFHEIEQKIIIKKTNKVPGPNVDTLRKMYFFHPRVHVVGLQKNITTISGLLTIVI